MSPAEISFISPISRAAEDVGPYKGYRLPLGFKSPRRGGACSSRVSPSLLISRATRRLRHIAPTTIPPSRFACHLPLHKGGFGLVATIRKPITFVGTGVPTVRNTARFTDITGGETLPYKEEYPRRAGACLPPKYRLFYRYRGRPAACGMSPLRQPLRHASRATSLYTREALGYMQPYGSQ